MSPLQTLGYLKKNKTTTHTERQAATHWQHSTWYNPQLWLYAQTFSLWVAPCAINVSCSCLFTAEWPRDTSHSTFIFSTFTFCIIVGTSTRRPCTRTAKHTVSKTIWRSLPKQSLQDKLLWSEDIETSNSGPTRSVARLELFCFCNCPPEDKRLLTHVT